MVFRPFKGETLLGKISSATPEGIHGTSVPFISGTNYSAGQATDTLHIVRTEFFEEIFVPYKELPENTEL